MNEVTVSTIQKGVRTCFPQLVSSPFDLLGEIDQPLTSDGDIRIYLQENVNKLIWIISLEVVDDKEAQEGPEEEPSYSLTSLPQREVAHQVLKRVCKVLTSEEDPTKLARKFKRTEYLIMVPKYNTLKQQTITWFDPAKMSQTSSSFTVGQDCQAAQAKSSRNRF